MADDGNPLWIDSHAHLTMFEGHEVGSVLQRAAERGVYGVLVPATGPQDLDRTLELASQWPNTIVAAAGVHPHDARLLDDAAARRVERALTAPGVVAVGEIGLDYHYMNSPREDQIRALEWQLDLALAADLPVVLHNRDSWQDLEPMLAAKSPRLRGVCHSFTEGPEEGRRVLELGLAVGVSGMVTFKAATNIRELVGALEPLHVMVETDSPFLAPVPHRGRRNEPGHVVHVGEHLADQWQLPVVEVARATTDRFRTLFSIPAGWPVALDSE
jgi:TatD DNase family protein